MNGREVYADIELSQRLLRISSLLVVALGVLLSVGILCVSVFWTLWQRDQEVERYFGNLIREVNQEEIFIEKARDQSEEILRDTDANGPFAVHVLSTFGPALHAAPINALVPVSGAPWSTSGVAIKFDWLSHGIDIDRLAMLTLRFMIFDGEFWGKEQPKKYSFLIAPNRSFASFRREDTMPGLDNAAVLLHTAEVVLDHINQATAVSGMPNKSARWTGRYRHPITGKVILTCFTPVYDVRRSLVLYIGTDVDPNNLLTNKRSAKLPDGEAVQLVGRDGNIVAWVGDASLDIPRKPAGFSMPLFGKSAVAVDLATRTISFERRIQSIGWRVVYSVRAQKIFWSQASLIAELALLLFLFILAVYYGKRYIRLRVIGPARRRAFALRESEEFAHAVLSTAPVGLAVIEPSGLSLRASNPIYDQGVDLIKTFGAVGLANLQRQLSAPPSGQVITQLVQETQPGKERRFYAITTAQQTLHGKPTLIFAVSDITEQKRSEAELLMSRNAIASANKAKDAFLATVSHEIRTPLFGMLASLELLADTALNAPQQYYVDVMESSTRNLLELINDLLDFSKIEADRFTISNRTVYLISELEEVGRSFATRARLQGLTLDWMIDPDFSRAVTTDPVRLAQIVTNLVGNAIKFTPAGNVSLDARIASFTDTHCTAVLRVKDSGVGISASEIDNLFKPFSQGGQSRSNSSGTGLGLSICRKLATLLGGDIYVESDVGRGSTFTVTLTLPWAEATLPHVVQVGSFAYATNIVRREWYLRSLIERAGYRPVAMSEHECTGTLAAGMLAFADEKTCAVSSSRVVLIDAKAPEVSSELVDEEAARVSMHVSAFRQDIIVEHIKNGTPQCYFGQHRGPIRDALSNNLYVLIVDDHVINGSILARQLETLGCMVDVYHDPREALDAFDPDSHQLILTDMNMPNMSGEEFAQSIKKINDAIPIIAVTADVRLEVSSAHQHVFELVMTKPVTVTQLDFAIQELVANNQLHAEKYVAQPSATGMASYQISSALRSKMTATMDLDLENCACAVMSLDLRRTEVLAHRMRGAFLAIRLPAIAALCGQLESTAMSGSMSNLPKFLKKINDEWRHCRESFLTSNDVD